MTLHDALLHTIIQMAAPAVLTILIVIVIVAIVIMSCLPRR